MLNVNFFALAYVAYKLIKLIAQADSLLFLDTEGYIRSNSCFFK